MRRTLYNVFIAGEKVGHTWAWNTARKLGVRELAKVMTGSQMEQIAFEITEREFQRPTAGNFTFESNEVMIKTFYIEKADDGM